MKSDLQHIKEKLGDYDSPLDTHQLWDDIVDRVPTKKKRRRPFFWLFLGLLFMGLAFYSISKMYMDSNSNKEDMESSPLANGVETHSFDGESKIISTMDEQQLVSDVQEIHSSSVSKSKLKHGMPIKSKSNSLVRPKKKKVAPNTMAPIHSLKKENNDIELDGASLVSNQNYHEGQNSIVYSTINQHILIQSIPGLKLMNLFPITTRSLAGPRLNDMTELTKASHNKWSVEAGYNLGLIKMMKTMGENSRSIDDGDPMFAQSAYLNTRYQLTDKMYAILAVDYNINYKRFEGSITKDTIVPSSEGETILRYIQTSGGIIDSESGVPEVSATLTRTISSNNSFATMDAGIGLGCRFECGKIDVALEGIIYRSIMRQNSGYAIEGEVPRIRSLSTFKDYYNESPRYRSSLAAKIILPVVKKVDFSLGASYDYQLTNEFTELSYVDARISRFWSSASLILYLD